MTKKKSYSRPKPPLGPYTKPHVCIVKLDPRQAVLSVCAVPGIYADNLIPWACKPGTRAATHDTCNHTVRGMNRGHSTAGGHTVVEPSWVGWRPRLAAWPGTVFFTCGVAESSSWTLVFALDIFDVKGCSLIEVSRRRRDRKYMRFWVCKST